MWEPVIGKKLEKLFNHNEPAILIFRGAEAAELIFGDTLKIVIKGSREVKNCAELDRTVELWYDGHSTICCCFPPNIIQLFNFSFRELEQIYVEKTGLKLTLQEEDRHEYKIMLRRIFQRLENMPDPDIHETLVKL